MQKLQLQTNRGCVEYTLERKRVRNLNLRIASDGSVRVSAPPKMPQKDIEAFLTLKSDWIYKHRQSVLQRQNLPPQHTKQECLELFTQISEQIFPLFSSLLGGKRPTLRVREMKTRWGVCNTVTKTITLNTRLADKPMAAIEYVVLHEYVHFLHPNHQEGFHAEMARLMPDYKQRRRLLRLAE